MTGLHS